MFKTVPLIDVVVSSREEQGVGIAIFELKPIDGDSLPTYDAGSHIDVFLKNEIVRQYSLCSDPKQSDVYRIGVLNDPNSRGGSIEVHETFQPGTRLKISEPRNHFPLAAGVQRTILAGGGIGITPLIAMAYQLQALGEDFEVHYCTRTQGAGAFEAELASSFPGRVFFHYDDAGDAQLFSPKAILTPYDVGTHIYVCGPAGFMDWAIEQASQQGYRPEQIHFEYFSADVDVSGEVIEVYCSESDVTVLVGEQQSIAKALIAAGVKVDVSCEEGVCGTCITDVLEGEPDHRDHFLNAEEKADMDQMAICCSRAKSKRLVLDI